jgi:hypothetical protein
VAVKKLVRFASLSGIAVIAAGILGGFQAEDSGVVPPAKQDMVDVALPGQEDVAWGAHRAEVEKIIAAAPPGAMVMKQAGLAGVQGGVRLSVGSGPQQVSLVMPQLADGQVPICYVISADPPDAVTEFRLRSRDDENVVVNVRLSGGSREVKLTWSAVVLVAAKNVNPKTAAPETYRAATACVQSDAEKITKLAEELWPDTGKAADFGANIQRHVREMKKKDRPRSFDALGILRSGENSICTANANLAAALMRAKGIASRSLAVIPPISQRLEMHRVVEYFEDDQWQAFDPSSVQADIPAKPWQNIIMAKTTARDEEVSMKLRMACPPGCPYGQEIEMLTNGVTLMPVQDFFWSLAKPLAEFQPTDEAIRAAVDSWKRYLETGTLTAGQIKAASAKNAAELLEAMTREGARDEP